MKPPRHLEILAMLCIFSVFLDKAIRGGLPFDFYYYYPIFILFLLAQLSYFKKIFFPPRWFNWAVLIITIISFIVTTLKGIVGFELLKQFIGIFFTAIVYYNVFYVFNFKIKRIFDIYLKFSFYVAAFGIINNMLHLAGIHITKQLDTGTFFYREVSIMGEPFYLTLALTPALLYYLINFKELWIPYKKQIVTILICYLLTFSSIAVAGLSIGIMIALYLNNFFSIRSNRLAILPLLIIPLFFVVSYFINNIDLLNARFYDTTKLFLSSQIMVEEAGKANSSTFALYSNYVIARDSFFKNPMFGSGLGSHPIIYYETFVSYFPSSYLKMYGAQNQQDANSKFLRLLSETGLLGLTLFLFAYFKFLIPKKKIRTADQKYLASINYAIFVYILLCLIRNGNYINIGFFLFFFIYYITYIQFKFISTPTKDF
jgi:hypothetical protein